MDEEGHFSARIAGKTCRTSEPSRSGRSPELGKAKIKKVELTLLIHPQWLAWLPEARRAGSANTAVARQTQLRRPSAGITHAPAKLRLFEVRGEVAGTELLARRQKCLFYG